MLTVMTALTLMLAPAGGDATPLAVPRLAPALLEDPAPAPSAEKPRREGTFLEFLGHSRFEFGFEVWFPDMHGRIEKEDFDVGPGSGGQKLSLRTDLDIPTYVEAWRVQIGIIDRTIAAVVAEGLWITGELHRMKGRNTLGEDFRHDGRLFTTGTIVRSLYETRMLDVDLRGRVIERSSEEALVPRPDLQGLIGIRLAQVRSIVEAPGQRVSESTTGAWPRVGINARIPLGAGIALHGQAAVGGWWIGNARGSFAAASLDLEGGITLDPVDFVQLRVTWRFQNFGIWRELGDDTERVTEMRNGVAFGLMVRTP